MTNRPPTPNKKPAYASFYRTWGLGNQFQDTLNFHRYDDEEGNPTGFEVVARGTTGTLVYLGFTPAEFVSFVCDLEEMI